MAEVIAVVKANAFGHGDVRVAHTAMRNGASGLGVTTYHEALGLRRAGITAPILTWLISPGDDHEAALAAELDIAVGTLDVLDAIARACVTTRRTGRIHLHVDCGMNREGARSSELLPLIHRARALERAGLIRVIGLMGHLPDAGLGPEHNDGGLELFADSYHQAFVAGLRPEIVHLAATAAALTDWRARSCPHRRHPRNATPQACDRPGTAPGPRVAIRIGAGLFGIDPSGTTTLASALTFRAPVLACHRVSAGGRVGYDGTWQAQHDTTLALLGCGYADGVPRSLSNRGHVWLAGKQRPIVGRVSMDQTVIDLAGDTVPPGEIATLFGHDGIAPTAAQWATWDHTIEHTIVTGIGHRPRRRYREEHRDEEAAPWTSQ